MSREEAIRILKEIEIPMNGDNERERTEALEMAIKALSVEPCDDCISRKDLVIKLNAWDYKAQGIPNYAWKVINEMPSVQPIILKGMTNGEVIQTLFQNISVYEHGSTYSVNNEYNFNSTWWNAPYER